LLVDFKSAMQPAVQIDQTASLNGLLNIRTSSTLPAGIYTVLTAKKLKGSYQKVTLNGQEITPIYQDNSLRFSPQNYLFAAGCILASWSFFFLLGYGARLVSPVFNRPHAWKVLDLSIGF
ncbi:hypothetical protein ACW7EJ_00145, partial [Acinetobacter soli]